MNKSNRRCSICQSKNGYVLATGLFVCRACGARTMKVEPVELVTEKLKENDLLGLLDETIEKKDKGIE